MDGKQLLAQRRGPHCYRSNCTLDPRGAALRGLTVWDYIDGYSTLAQLGVTAENAAKTLKPQMPTAHEHYNEHGGSSRVYHSWEEWFSHRLRNRIFYFFHKHGPDRGTYRCVAEWPLEEPQRPKVPA
ncbi:hypothetical protein [Celeribacter indicus]|uniref:Uncharacterized protein n=1 Tax=Celeribacter indicus TaxID=1208324 RepID=A0A0B5DPJ8_9RHOB|nr:hypothetical protein [Celeribacter indicus]AJE45089.1 hypothetical protein P73_0374 [Celeribacter indicus]SDX42979.1 hypothetical protein SAMN05443573_12750 [Celeribacter indicus]